MIFFEKSCPNVLKVRKGTKVISAFLDIREYDENYLSEKEIPSKQKKQR